MTWRICPECKGEGKVVHPALSVWTQEDRMDDPEGFDEMMQGVYDRPCAMCDGTGKVKAHQIDDFNERLDDARTMGMECGDPEMFYNPRQGLY